jgi:tetratricopeptide (TPR) repeat protein
MGKMDRRMQISHFTKAIPVSIFLLVASFSPVKADNNEEANRLFVAAVKAWSEVHQTSGNSLEDVERRFFLLDETANNLNRIVSDYPGADLAVKLVIGEEIGPLSLSQVREGRDDAAKEVARALSNCSIPTECIIGHAHETARRIDNESQRARALAEIALTVVNERMLDEALDSTSSTDGFFGRDSLLQSFAYAQIELGNFSGAQITVLEIGDLERRGYVYNRLVSGLAKSGQISVAQEIAQGRIDAHYDLDGMLESIAIAQAMEGLTSDSLSTLSGMLYDFSRDRALKEISILQAKAGLRTDAMNTIRIIQSPGHLVEALARVAVAIDESSLFASALEIANGIDDEHARDVALQEISAAQADAGLFEEAMRTPGGIRNRAWRDNAFERVAVAQAKAGLFSDSLDTLRRIEDSYSLDEALVQITGLLAEAGRYSEAHELVRNIKEEWNREDAVEAIAASQAKSGYFDEALEIAHNPDGPIFLGAFREVVKAQAEAGLLRQSIDTAMELENANHRISMLVSISESLSK